MSIKVNAVIAVLIALQSIVAHAATPIPATDVSLSTTIYAFSGILRSNANGAVIKLVQGVHLAISLDAAVNALSRECLIKYPEYSLIDTMALPVSACAPKRPRKQPLSLSI